MLRLVLDIVEGNDKRVEVEAVAVVYQKAIVEGVNHF